MLCSEPVVSLSLLTACLLHFLTGLYFSRFNAFGRVTALEPDPPPSAGAVLVAVLHVPLLLQLRLPDSLAPAQHPQHHFLPQGKPFASAQSALQ